MIFIYIIGHRGKVIAWSCVPQLSESEKAGTETDGALFSGHKRTRSRASAAPWRIGAQWKLEPYHVSRALGLGF